MKKCSDIMTRDLVTCTPEDSIVKAAQLMKKEDIGPILVVDDSNGGTLVGILTDRDLVLRVIADGQDPARTTVGDVMSKKLITCHVNDGVDSVMQAMAQYQLRRIPVVEDAMKLAGIISQADVATRVDVPERTGEVVKEISEETA